MPKPAATGPQRHGSASAEPIADTLTPDAAGVVLALRSVLQPVLGVLDGVL